MGGGGGGLTKAMCWPTFLVARCDSELVIRSGLAEAFFSNVAVTAVGVSISSCSRWRPAAAAILIPLTHLAISLVRQDLSLTCPVCLHHHLGAVQRHPNQRLRRMANCMRVWSSAKGAIASHAVYHQRMRTVPIQNKRRSSRVHLLHVYAMAVIYSGAKIRKLAH